MVNSKGFQDHPFNFDCVNTVYFLKAVEGYTHSLTELEMSRYKNAKQTALIQNPEINNQFKCFKKIIDLVNWLVEKWDM